MKKLSTHVKGLDALFQGGIQVDSLTLNKSNENDSLIIVIRGECGTHKHLLAMQMMHGLAMSINESLSNKYVHRIEKGNACYYSISKPVQRLNDMYIDLLIMRWIDAMTYAIKRSNNDITEGKETKTFISNRENDRHAALSFWFNTDVNDKDYPSPIHSRRFIDSNYGENVPEMLADNLANYNTRTNSIHYRRVLQGDDDKSLLYMRRHDTIAQYVDDYNKSKADLKNYREVSEKFSFDSEFLDVKFTHDEYDTSQDDIIGRNSREATNKFFKILHGIEDELEKDEIGRCSSCGQRTNGETRSQYSPFVHEVVVIDGFSHIDDKTLKSLPYTHLQDTLRKLSRISILVFDDRENVGCDGDIIIELRKGYDDKEEYSFLELQIVKSIFQTTAQGWHQYKRRDEGIVVFPSIHLLLTKRHYIANRVHAIGASIMQDSYEQFLEAKIHFDGAQNKLLKMDNSQLKNYFNEFYLEEYLISTENQPIDLLAAIIAKQTEPIDNGEKSVMYINDTYAIRILETSLLGFPTPKDQYSQLPSGWCDHYPSTAIVGNPNSYKRKLVLSHAFHWAKRKEHVLFVFFDKNEDDLRKQMLCPAIGDRVALGEKIDKCSNELTPCLKCYRYIHSLRVRSGCITPEEFFSMLLEQIAIYCDEDPIHGLERRRLHIIIDDFQRIDFCFPFIRSSSLFTDALINICHEHNVELTILCDKSGERAREVCTLADNVLCIERNENDINNIAIYVERTSQPPFPSAILKYDVTDVENMFTCSTNLKIRFEFDGKSIIEHKVIGSMKEYWRQTENIYIKNNSIKVDNYQDKADSSESKNESQD